MQRRFAARACSNGLLYLSEVRGLGACHAAWQGTCDPPSAENAASAAQTVLESFPSTALHSGLQACVLVLHLRVQRCVLLLCTSACDRSKYTCRSHMQGCLYADQHSHSVGLVDRIEMCRTDCFRKTSFLTHVTSSS